MNMFQCQQALYLMISNKYFINFDMLDSPECDLKLFFFNLK